MAAMTGSSSVLPDRRPRLDQDPAPGTELLHLALGEVGVHLDLMDRGHDLRAVQQGSEVIDLKSLTPIARTFPSASRLSSARQASCVASKSDGRACAR
jgi:hypothetical protein